MKAQIKKESEVHDGSKAWDFLYFALALVVAASISFLLQLLPAEGVFILFGLLFLVGLVRALTHHPHS